MTLLVENIFKSYESGHRGLQILKGFTWQAEAGRVCGLIGDNGAGKTTMLHVLLGLTPCQSGRVTWNGRVLFDNGSPVNLEQLNSLRQNFAWLPENPNLPRHQRGFDVLMEYALFDGIAPAPAREKVHQAIVDFDLSKFIQKTCETYSRGQAVLLSLARFSLLNRPVLLLDEPTAGLDFNHAKMVRDWIKKQASLGKCVIVSTHLLPDLIDLGADLVGLVDGRAARPETLSQWVGSWSQKTPQIDPAALPGPPPNHLDKSHS